MQPDPPDQPPHTGPWRREAHTTLVCACRHTSTEHRHNLTTSSPCHRGGCGCRWMRPTYAYVREWRTVEVPITPDTLKQWTGPTPPAGPTNAAQAAATPTSTKAT